MYSDQFSVHEQEYQLKLARTLATLNSEVFDLRYSEDGRFLAAACGDGSIRVLQASSGQLVGNLTAVDPDASEKRGHAGAAANGITDIVMPCTSLAFRPDHEGAKTSNVLVAGYSDGFVKHWHAPSGKLLHSMRLPGEVEALTVAYSPDAATFAVGATDGHVRVYHEDTKELLTALRPGVGQGNSTTAGHSNRVFSIKYHRTDSNLLVSAGWDNCVHVWDVRQAHSVLTIFGPHVAGDAMDLTSTEILTGSWRRSAQLQVWALEGGSLVKEIPWRPRLTQGGVGDATACRLYAAAFSHGPGADGKFIAAGGGDGSNECKVYHHAEHDTLIGSVLGLRAGVMAVAFSPAGERLAVGLGNGTIHLVDIVSSDADPSKTEDHVLVL